MNTPIFDQLMAEFFGTRPAKIPEVRPMTKRERHKLSREQNRIMAGATA